MTDGPDGVRPSGPAPDEEAGRAIGPAPDTGPAPQPEPDTGPGPAPAPAPDSEPTPQAVPEPEPVPEPEGGPKAQPDAATGAEVGSEPEGATEPAAGPELAAATSELPTVDGTQAAQAEPAWTPRADGPSEDEITSRWTPSPDPDDDDVSAAARAPAAGRPTWEDDDTPALDPHRGPDNSGPISVLRQSDDPYRARHLRQTLTFVVLFLLVMAIGIGGYGFYRGTWTWPLGQPAEAVVVPCPVPTPTAALAKDVEVNVLNATGKRGLAGEVAKQLQQRGLTVPTIANDPLKAKIPGVAAIRFGPNGELAAKTVEAQVAGAVQRVPDKRTDATVDLVLGNTFKALRPDKEARALVTVPPVPSPAGCVTPTPTPTTQEPTLSDTGAPTVTP